MSKFFISFLVAIMAGLLPLAAQPLEVAGITEPYMDVTLGLADPGIINVQLYKEGDYVPKGKVILELDKNLEAIEVERRKAVMDQDQMVYQSTLELSQTTKSVSHEDLTKAEAQYRVSASEYQTALQQLADRALKAPFSGVITEVLLKPGAAVAPYQPLVRLVDTTRCFFVGHMDGLAVSRLHLGEKVKIDVDGGYTVDAQISFISPVVDAASGLARIKALFDNPSGTIRPGLAARLVAD